MDKILEGRIALLEVGDEIYYSGCCEYISQIHSDYIIIGGLIDAKRGYKVTKSNISYNELFNHFQYSIFEVVKL